MDVIKVSIILLNVLCKVLEKYIVYMCVWGVFFNEEMLNFLMPWSDRKKCLLSFFILWETLAALLLQQP